MGKREAEIEDIQFKEWLDNSEGPLNSSMIVGTIMKSAVDAGGGSADMSLSVCAAFWLVKRKVTSRDCRDGGEDLSASALPRSFPA
jgi:hypothetical protein